MPWAHFAVSAIIVIYFAHVLTQQGEKIAQQTSLGRFWVGSLLLAVTTSLPELVTTIKSGIIAAPDLAVGNILGSMLFNIFIIAVANLAHGSSILADLNKQHLYSAALGTVLIIVMALSLITHFGSILGLGVESWVIMIICLLSFRFFINQPTTSVKPRGSCTGMGKFLFFALIVIIAAGKLTSSAQELAISTGWGQTIVGSTLLAIATSLPELAVSITAVRKGWLDLAVGNLLGSNIINVLLLVVADLSFASAPILWMAETAHLTTMSFILLLNMVVMGTIFYHPRKMGFRLGFDGLAIVVIYLAATYVLF